MLLSANGRHLSLTSHSTSVFLSRKEDSGRGLLALLMAGLILLQPVTLMAQRRRALQVNPQTSAKPNISKNIGDPNISVTTLPTTITQNFDTLPASGSATFVNNSTLTGWYSARTGTGTTIVANDGSSNAGNLYSYGTGTATDRALGSVGSGNAAIGNLFWGILLTNNTGQTVTSLDVSYTGEQWRNSAAAAQTVSFSYVTGTTITGSLADFQAAGTNVTALDFTSPITLGTAGALNGNLAANRVAISSTITGVNLADGQSILLRWSDPDHSGADHGLSIDDFSVTANAGAVTPTVNINDVTQGEGDAGTTSFTFTVSLSAPAGLGGVTFDIATADGTATAPSDYTSKSLTGQTIPAGSSSYFFTVLVNGDTTTEPNETFFANVTNITGANAGDTQGQGTITNDDVTLTPIHTIQGSGSTSPLAGTSVTTRGIVTGIKAGSSGGFFIQEPDASVDADPNTSEGIFVFTGSSVPPGAVTGNYVQVGGTVQEFVFSSDPNSPPITELSGAITVSVLTTGNTLPAPHTLTGAETTAPSGTSNPLDSLEEFEFMRVTVSSLTVVAPTDGTINEPNATVSGNDVFYGVVTGVARPFREAGVNVSDATAMGLPGTIPRFDENPERIRVDSDGQPGTTAVDAPAGTVLTNITGPLDYSFRTYTILPDTTITLPGVLPGSVAVPTPTANEVTLASFNMERFYDTVDDPGGDVVLTATAFNKRLDKASRIIRTVQRYPDVIGVEEMEDLKTLQQVAARVNSDAVSIDALPSPNYVPYLVEGNDVGLIDVGFLVKESRVATLSVTQYNKNELFVNPDASTSLLNDRPPLVLRATAPRPAGGTFAFTVIVNHLRSLNGIDDPTAGANGWPTEGDRVRAKRQKQAESLANLIQNFQTSDPTDRIITVGDMNAFHVNDGYVDVIDTIKGMPVPDNQTLVPGDGADLVTPNLTDLVDTLAVDQRYSYSFDGNAQVLDHIIVNPPALAVVNRFAYARDDADFPVKNYELANELRLSDHDQPIVYLSLTASGVAQAPGTVIISEFRFRGFGGPTDEFVELYNNTNADISVATTDGSSGWAVVTADGVVRFVVPNGTVIPARGHYLGTNSSGYSLDAYATGDATFTTDIPDNSGVALFRTANPTNFTLSERLDAAGYSAVNALYREGAGFPTGGGETIFNIDYTFFRLMTKITSGLPKDTGDNLSDFILVNTTGSLTGMGATLGAPGPENLASPINRNAQFGIALVDPAASSSAAPNRTRDFTPVPNGSNGTMQILRTFTNNTGAPVTRLRFRIVDITTFVYPPVSGLADLRALDSTDTTVVVNMVSVNVRGTTVDQPPVQINGGAWNSSLNVGFVGLRTPLANGDSVSVRFRLGIMTPGTFRFLLNVEALP